MKTASVAELKAKLSEYIATAKRGEDVIVTDRGRPVAKLTALVGAEHRNEKLEKAIREGHLIAPTSKLPPDFFSRPRLQDPEGLVLKALLEEREEGW